MPKSKLAQLRRQLPINSYEKISESLSLKGVKVSSSLVAKVLQGKRNDNNRIIEEAIALVREHKSKKQELVKAIDSL